MVISLVIFLRYRNVIVSLFETMKAYNKMNNESILFIVYVTNNLAWGRDWVGLTLAALELWIK